MTAPKNEETEIRDRLQVKSVELQGTDTVLVTLENSLISSSYLPVGSHRLGKIQEMTYYCNMNKAPKVGTYVDVVGKIENGP